MARPPLHRGEAVHSARLTESQVRTIKAQLADGRSVKELAEEAGVGYMVIYKIATGDTWANGDGRIIARRSKGITPKKRDKLYEAKLRKGASNAKLAKVARVSESVVARAMRDAHAIMAARAHRMLLTSGSHEAARERFGLTQEEVEELVTYSATHPLPKHLQRELDDE